MAFVTIADTGVISYISTKNLAERWGFGALSWLYPLCLDAVAAVGMDLWMSNSPAKRAAACLSLSAVGLSLAANVADWLYVGPGAAVLGAVPPLMLAALLLTMHRHAAHTTPSSTPSLAAGTGPASVAPVPAAVPVTGAVDIDAEAPPTVPDPNAQPAAAEPTGGRTARTTSLRNRKAPSSDRPRQPRKGPQPDVSDHEVIKALREREQQGEPLSRRSVMAEYRMGTPRATRLMAAASNGTHLTISDHHRGDS
ncbi:DUF2637 domain-containing protein [Actinophytocola sp.]|uniref:DUF2637 domain-containing protein n=1 Tax=Actinophytocola sp. TaxID=1872138 RepID=UPI003D6C6303